MVLIATIETKILKTNLYFIKNTITVDLMAIIRIIAAAATAIVIIVAVGKLIIVMFALVALVA